MNPLQSPQVSAPVSTMTLTGLGSSAIGDQIGDALAKILAWVVAVNCGCVPPADIINAFHTVCVAATVGVAFYIHYSFLKPQA